MSEVTVGPATTTIRLLHPHRAEDEAGFRRRMAAMAAALQQCDAGWAAVVIVQPGGALACVVTQAPLRA